MVHGGGEKGSVATASCITLIYSLTCLRLGVYKCVYRIIGIRYGVLGDYYVYKCQMPIRVQQEMVGIKIGTRIKIK